MVPFQFEDIVPSRRVRNKLWTSNCLNNKITICDKFGMHYKIFKYIYQKTRFHCTFSALAYIYIRPDYDIDCLLVRLLLLIYSNICEVLQ